MSPSRPRLPLLRLVSFGAYCHDMHPRRVRHRGTAVVLVAGLICALFVNTRYAPYAMATPCQHQLFPRGQVGYERVPQGGTENWEGVSAHISILPGGLCGGDNGSSNFYCTWVMLADQSGYFMQIGDIKYVNTSYTFTFVEVNSATGFFQGPNVSNGDTHQYWEQYNPSAHVEKFNEDNVNIRTTTFDPRATWKQPEVPQLMSETSYLENSIPGTTANPVLYDTILFQRIDNNAFEPFNTGQLMPTVPIKNAPWARFVVNSSETETYTE